MFHGLFFQCMIGVYRGDALKLAHAIGVQSLAETPTPFNPKKPKPETP